jgi:hypothetical protein
MRKKKVTLKMSMAMQIDMLALHKFHAKNLCSIDIAKQSSFATKVSSLTKSCIIP